jgi:hypothetical protein
MNNSNKIKYWDLEEENKLIDEINNLVDIDKILKNHDRKLTGIIMRIEKILNEPTFSDKIKNKNEIIIKYLKSKPKNYIDYNELYSNILKFKSLEEISSNYNNIQISKIKQILTYLLNSKEDMDISKKLRIKCLLNDDNKTDCYSEIIKKNNFEKNTENKNENKNENENKNKNENDNNLKNNLNNSDITTLIINLLNEFKSIKVDIFDMKNRVKIIMDKVNKIEKIYVNNIKSSKSSKFIKKKYVDEINNLTEENNLNNKIQLENQNNTFDVKIINQNKNTKNNMEKFTKPDTNNIININSKIININDNLSNNDYIDIFDFENNNNNNNIINNTNNIVNDIDIDNNIDNIIDNIIVNDIDKVIYKDTIISKNEKNINKKVEKIISSTTKEKKNKTNKKNSKINNFNLSSDNNSNDDELEKEFEKYLK